MDVASQEPGLNASLLEDAPRRRRWTIRQLLALMVFATVVPLILVLILTVVNIAKASRKAQVDALLYTTQTVVGALDAHLKQYVTIAEILAKSPALLNDDLSVFRAEAERAFPDAAEAALVVSDLNGQQLLNLLLPAGAPLPRRSETSLATQARAFSEKTFVISGVFRGQVRGEWVADIEMPVFRDGRPFRSLTVTLTAKGIFKLLNAQKIPAGWLAGIIDTSGRFLARIPANDVYVGQLASASWREVMHREGIFEFKTLEGHTTVGANLIEPISRWPVAVSAQTSVLDAPTWGTTKWAVIGMTAISMISLVLALVITRVISQPIVDLEKQASALLAGKAAQLHTEVSEIAHAWATLKEVVAERRRAEDQQRFLQNELAHRSKNLLAVVQTLVRMMGRSTATPEQFSDELQSRLHSLALAQDLLTKSQSKGTDLSALARQQLSMFLPKDGESRVTFGGPAVFLPASNVTSVSMVLHELATNASKYGALSIPAGKIQMSWSLLGEGSVLRLTWKESGGPAAAPPDQKGFGSILLERTTARFEPQYLPMGFRCAIEFGLDTAVPGDFGIRRSRGPDYN